MVENLPANARDSGSIPGLGGYPGEGNATHCGLLAWRIPWAEEPGRLQSMGLKEPDKTEGLSMSRASCPNTVGIWGWRILCRGGRGAVLGVLITVLSSIHPQDTNSFPLAVTLKCFRWTGLPLGGRITPKVSLWAGPPPMFGLSAPAPLKVTLKMISGPWF